MYSDRSCADDEQPRHRRIEPAFDQVVDECLDNGSVLGRAFGQRERMFHASASIPIAAIVGDVDAFDLHHQKVEVWKGPSPAIWSGFWLKDHSKAPVIVKSDGKLRADANKSGKKDDTSCFPGQLRAPDERSDNYS